MTDSDWTIRIIDWVQTAAALIISSVLWGIVITLLMQRSGG